MKQETRILQLWITFLVLEHTATFRAFSVRIQAWVLRTTARSKVIPRAALFSIPGSSDLHASMIYIYTKMCQERLAAPLTTTPSSRALKQAGHARWAHEEGRETPPRIAEEQEPRRHRHRHPAEILGLLPRIRTQPWRQRQQLQHTDRHRQPTRRARRRGPNPEPRDAPKQQQQLHQHAQQAIVVVVVATLIDCFIATVPRDGANHEQLWLQPQRFVKRRDGFSRHRSTVAGTKTNFFLEPRGHSAPSAHPAAPLAKSKLASRQRPKGR